MTNYHAESSSGRAARETRLALMESAFTTVIGYINPGNFATSIQTGVSFDYWLLWVVVWTNLTAMLIQILSARLGIATGKNLAEQARDHYPRPIVWFYWVQTEVIAMATGLVEFIGAVIDFKLILGVSSLQGVVLTGIATFLILMLQRRGQRPLEKVIGGLLLFVVVTYTVELILSWPSLAQLGKGMVIPSLSTSEAAFLIAGALGATIMSRVIYLYSSLTQHLHSGSRQQRYSATKQDVAITTTIAGFISPAMMATATAAFYLSGHTDVTGLDEAYLTLQSLLGRTAATVFGLSLVAAGLSSTAVGTLAGQVVMQGFIRFHIPLWVRCTVIILPSLVIVLMGLGPTRILVMSQILLSSDIASALIPLLIFTSDSKLTGDLVNSKHVKQTDWVIVVLVVALSIWLLVGMTLGLWLSERRIWHRWRIRRKCFIRPTR